MNYIHLTIEERSCIYQFKNLGMSIREIAKALRRNPITISIELSRNGYRSNGMYHPTAAQNKYEIRREKCHRHISLNNDEK